MSFQEKSLWVMLIGLVLAFGGYFAVVLPGHTLEVQPQQVVLFVVATIVLVIVQVVGQSIVAILDRKTSTDERDRLIALKGTRNGAYLLATGVFFALCAAVWVPGNFVFAHVLLAFWVLAQLLEIATQLYSYRRGV
jgi:drug/metabolite transporter (DMT)-like permease